MYVAAGLVASVVGQTLMGESGEVIVALMILMAVTCTGSAEVIAVTSILVYDIYQIYLKVRLRIYTTTSVTFGDPSCHVRYQSIFCSSICHVTTKPSLIFTARCYAERGYATELSVCPPVCKR